MAQYIYLQDDSMLNDNNVQILNAPQQVLTPTGDRNVFVYHQTQTQQSPTLPSNQNLQASQFQHQQGGHQPQQWLQSIPTGQVIYASAPQAQHQQQTVITQSPMNVIVQPNQMNSTQQSPLNQTTYMKVVTVNTSPQQTVMIPRAAAVRPSLVPVVLNPGYRTPVSQSILIQQQNQAPALRPSNMQQNATQQVIVDPRAYMQSSSGQAGVVQRPTYRVVSAKPLPSITPNTARHTRPVSHPPQPRVVQQRPIRPPVKFVRPPGLQTVRVVRHPGTGQPAPRLLRGAVGGGAPLRYQPVRLANSAPRAPQNQALLRKLVPPQQAVRGYSPVPQRHPHSAPGTVLRSPQPAQQPSWSPMVEVRPPQPAAGNCKSDDDIEDALSTAILHRAPPQPSNTYNGQPGPSKQQQPALRHKGPPGSVDISAVTHTNVISTNSSVATAKMMVILPDEERRLITFTLPSESCTVNELLEQVGIELTPTMNVHCMEVVDETLDYVVRITDGHDPEKKQEAPPATAQQMVQVVVQQQQQKTMSYVQASERGLIHPLPSVVTATPPPPVHVPKYIEGYLAICESCGFLSMDHSKCERCHRVLSLPQKKPVRPLVAPTTITMTTEPVTTRQVVAIPMAKPSVVTPLKATTPSTATKIKRASLSARSPLIKARGGAAGAVKGSPAKARSGSRVRKLEEPVVLTLSSDDEEQQDNSQLGEPQQYPFEPVYAEEGGSGDAVSTDISDPDRVDICSEIGKSNSVNTTLECKELRFGSYAVHSVQHPHMVAITHLGIKFIVPHVTEKGQHKVLNIQRREIMKLVVHYGNQLPVFFLYTTPACGRYIRKQLGMVSVLPPHSSGKVVPPFYDPTNMCRQEVKRIIFVAKTIRDDTKTAIKVLFSATNYDEIPYRDALNLLLSCRGSGESGAESAEVSGGSASMHMSSSGGIVSKRSSAMVAMATIKKYAATGEMDVFAKGRAAVRSGGEAVTGSSSQPQDSSQGIHKLMIYPPQGKGGISINTEDYQCLAVDQYLNDVIIDFYLKYLSEEVMTPEQRVKTHIFSSFFYKRLTATSARQRHLERELKMTAAQKRHNRVKSWTKNVDLFEKDFVIIPINELSHWFLAVICFPGLIRARSAKTKQEVQGPITKSGRPKTAASGLTKQAVKDMEKRKSGLMSVTIGNTTITPVGKREENIYVNEETLSERDEAEGDESDMMTEDEDENGEERVRASQEQLMDPIEQPCILVFDSLRGTVRSRVTATLREYLTCEFAARKASPETPKSGKTFDKDQMPGHNAKVPQQNNFTDCGLFVLQYVEEMIRNPIADFRLPVKSLQTWFNTQKVTRKREEIAVLIRKLLEKEHADRIPLLPVIDFPTVNGELVEAAKEPPLVTTPPPPKPEPMRTDEDEDGADSEDLFDEILNTVVNEDDEEEEKEEGANGNACGKTKVATKLLIPSLNKRKSSMVDPGGSTSPGGSSSSDSQSLRKKTARISN